MKAIIFLCFMGLVGCAAQPQVVVEREDCTSKVNELEICKQAVEILRAECVK